MGAGFLTPLFFTVFSLGLMSCGDISLDRGSSLHLNEPIPAGSVLLRQGSIATSSSTSLGGTAQVYASSGGSAIVRLAGFATDGSGLYLFLETADSMSYYVTPLKASSGQQNYLTGRPVAGQTFSRVVFRTSANPNALEIGAASLLSAN